MRPLGSRRLRRATSALLLVGALAACSGGGDGGGDGDSASPGPGSDSATAAAPEATPAPPAPRPRKHACYDLTYDDLLAPTTGVGPSRCREQHTTVTYHVGALDNVVAGHLLAVDSDRVQDAIAEECPQRLGDYVGGTEQDLRLSMLRAVWFSPTLEQADAGADWFRCDAALLAADERLAALPRDLAGALEPDDWADRFGMCGTADPSTREFRRVACAEEHSWRAIDTVDAPDGPYPGAEALNDQGRDACEDPAREVADDPLEVTWSFEPPTQEQWRSGRHYGICWVPVG